MNIKNTAVLFLLCCLQSAAQSIQLVPSPAFGSQAEVDELQQFVNTYYLPYAPKSQLIPQVTTIGLDVSPDGISHPGCIPVYAIAFPNNISRALNSNDGLNWTLAHELSGLNPCNQNFRTDWPNGPEVTEMMAGAKANTLFTDISKDNSDFSLLTFSYTAWLELNTPRNSTGGSNYWYNQQFQNALSGIYELFTSGYYTDLDNKFNESFQKGGEFDTTGVASYPLSEFMTFLDKNLPSFNGRTLSETLMPSPMLYLNGSDGLFPVIEIATFAQELTPARQTSPTDFYDTYSPLSPVLGSGQPGTTFHAISKQNGQTTIVPGVAMLITVRDWTGKEMWHQIIQTEGLFELPHMEDYDYGLYQAVACFPDSSGSCDTTRPTMTTYALSLKGLSDHYNPNKFYVLGNGPDTWTQMSSGLNLSVISGDPSVSWTYNHGILALDLGGSKNPFTVSDGARSKTLTPGIYTQFWPWTPLDEPLISNGGVVNGATFQTGLLAPNQIFSIFGLTFGNDHAQSATTSPLPTKMGRVQVSILASDGQTYLCPLLYVRHDQINAIVPAGIPIGNASVVVTAGITQSNSQTVTIAATAPGIFLASNGLGAIIHQDGSLVTSSNTAITGEYLSIYCTGLGQTSPAAETALPAKALPVMSSTQISWAGKTIQPSWSGLAPGFSGLYQVNFQVPIGIPSGMTSANNLYITSGGQNSNTVLLP